MSFSALVIPASVRMSWESLVIRIYSTPALSASELNKLFGPQQNSTNAICCVVEEGEEGWKPEALPNGEGSPTPLGASRPMFIGCWAARALASFSDSDRP